jgi:hypothetical protein
MQQTGRACAIIETTKGRLTPLVANETPLTFSVTRADLFGNFPTISSILGGKPLNLACKISKTDQ